jgi:hypothetical protein
MNSLDIISSKDKDKLDFDLIEDVIYFMNNEPKFYRKEYYPFMFKFKKYIDAGKRLKPVVFKPMCEKAFKIYQNKFPQESMHLSLEDSDYKDMCGKLYEKEMSNIEEGHYD